MTATAIPARSHAPARVRSAAPTLWVAGLAAVVIVFAVHDIGYLVRHPYTNDEAWVALFRYERWSDLPSQALSTLLGFAAAVKLLPTRLLPLAFAAGSAVCGVVLAATLSWRSPAVRFMVAAATGIAAAAMPAALLRQDLKQYTADGFFSLLVLVLLVHAERDDTDRAGIALAAGVAVAALFSTSSLFFAVPGLGLLLLQRLRRRGLARWREVAPLAAAGAFGLGVALASSARISSTFYTFWKGTFLPRGSGLGAVVSTIWARLGDAAGHTGLRWAPLLLVLVVAGLAKLVRSGASAAAGAVVGAFLILLVLGLAQRFPFLEARTGFFTFMVLGVVAVIGTAIIERLWSSRALVGACAAVALVAIWVTASLPSLRAHNLTAPLIDEDVRAQVAEVRRMATPRDAVVVSLSSWGFAYYWPDKSFTFQPNPVVLNGSTVTYPGQKRIVVATNRDRPSVLHALQQGLDMARADGGRVWIVRTHVLHGEELAWQAAFHSTGLQPTTLPVGPEPLLVVAPSR